MPFETKTKNLLSMYHVGGGEVNSCLRSTSISLKSGLIDTMPRETAAICTFESVAGDIFSVARPPLSQEVEAEIIAVLREILKDEGMLKQHPS